MAEFWPITENILSGERLTPTDATNTVRNRYAYSPYGKVLGQEQAINQPFKYAGQVGIFSENDNLYYMRARYYDAETGRFISEDPAGFVDGPNLYAYVGGNPIGRNDPSGLCGLPCGVVGAIFNVGVSAAFDDNLTWQDAGVAAVTGFVGGAYYQGWGLRWQRDWVLRALEERVQPLLVASLVGEVQMLFPSL